MNIDPNNTSNPLLYRRLLDLWETATHLPASSLDPLTYGVLTEMIEGTSGFEDDPRITASNIANDALNFAKVLLGFADELASIARPIPPPVAPYSCLVCNDREYIEAGPICFNHRITCIERCTVCSSTHSDLCAAQHAFSVDGIRTQHVVCGGHEHFVKIH